MKAQHSITGTITGDCTQFNGTSGTKVTKWTEKFREPSFRDNLVVGCILAITVSPLLFLVGMYIVQVYVWR